jgi:hypothetical protein
MEKNDSNTNEKGKSSFFGRKIPLLIGVVLLLGGCCFGSFFGFIIAPSETNPTQVVTEISQAITKVAAVTYTPYPTYTKQPTYTLQPTMEPIIVTVTNSPTPKFTPTDTSTPTITPTPTRTPTSTSTPNATQTQRAIINATEGADATATKVAQNARATEIAEYEKISYDELVTYPDSHIGEKVWVEGRIFNINGNTELQIWLGWTYDAAYIVMREPFSGIYEDNWITVYGTIYGENCGTNAYGAEVCQPILTDAFYTKP